MSDILVEIPNAQLPELAALYESRASWAPHMSTLVHTGIKWKRSDKYKDSITFLSPRNSWEEDGTVIVLVNLFCQDIHVFTLDDHCTNLYQGLSKTKRITYENKRSYFYAVHEKFIPTVKRCLQEKNIKIAKDMPCLLYGLPPAQLVLQCPSDVYVKKIQPSDAKQINDLWPHPFFNSDKYIAGFIEINGGYGVFLKSSDQMVAWAVRHVFGNPTVLQTEVAHKRKGYASLVMKAFAKEIGEEGYWTVVTVLPDNRAAIDAFEKLGFGKIASCTFIAVE